MYVSLALSAAALLSVCAADSATHDGELYILIDAAKVFPCQGVVNQISLTEDDVDIRDAFGRRAHFIQAPGNYSIEFSNVRLEKDVGELIGELAVTLQVPIFDGPAGLRFDLPQQIVPEKSLLSHRCDANSGVVTRRGRHYCRYCDMCSTGRSVERRHNLEGHKYVSADSPDDDGAEQLCSPIAADSYRLRRRISLPSREQLEETARRHFPDLDEDVRAKLELGRGRLQVFLNVQSRAEPVASRDEVWLQTKKCRCCSTLTRDELGCSLLRLFACDLERCKSAHADQCLGDAPAPVVCAVAEFAYRMTAERDEVRRFLREKGLPDELTAPTTTTTTTTTTAPPQPFGDSLPERCVGAIIDKYDHYRKYCSIFWNAPRCCAFCPGIC